MYVIFGPSYRIVCSFYPVCHLPICPRLLRMCRERESVWPGRQRVREKSDRLPTAVINIGLELPADEARNAVAEPEVTQYGVVAFLAEEQLPVVAQIGVDLAVLVDERSVVERARYPVEVEDGALADVDEETNVSLASVQGEKTRVSTCPTCPSQLDVATPLLTSSCVVARRQSSLEGRVRHLVVLEAADGLAAEQGTAHETDVGIREVLSG